MKLKLLLGTLMLTAITANAQVATINESFESFTTGTGAIWPQNGWSKVATATTPRVYADGTTDKYAQFYGFFYTGVEAYLVSPQIVAPDGSKSLTFTFAQTSGSAGVGTIQAGLISESSTTGTADFTPISSVYTATSTTKQTVTVTVPASSKQYIAFKFIGNVQHAAVLIDDVMYNTSSTLAVSDNAKSKEDVQFAVNAENTALQFVAKKDPKNIEIYSAGAQKVAGGKLSDKSFDISALQTGVYYIIIETAEGSVVKSKFIKK
ncbi:Por secretion system C-terminal sorting domain-containing protein [Chryseobacterium arachidis]|uniref:Por secretion system C-terminal sorting domain-containing protein n=1 Tax=Chryseobacterium arachidis TaxID=1416778 RepID=A0A1M4UDR5_9FLAO|nr:T9SS type A sorting domain-containing protein [Chryseobacterium arachidis]SHE54824.1 Por secretion system C-terminal sorting domain-containing protein [Chryseobacterium arachidis]